MQQADHDYLSRWYGLAVRPKQEELVATMLRHKGYQNYVPKYRNPLSNGRRRQYRNLFPGYVFCRFSRENRGGDLVVTTPGVIRIVGVGRQPTPIADSEIDAIQRALASDLPSEPWSYLQSGARVQVSSGPLRGIQGILLCVKGSDRVVLSLEILQRSLAVIVHREWVSPVDERQQSCCA